MNDSPLKPVWYTVECENGCGTLRHKHPPRRHVSELDDTMRVRCKGCKSIQLAESEL